MAKTPEQQIVAGRDLDVDHREAVRRIDGKEIDFSAWHARDARVDCAQVRFERALAFTECDAQFLPRNGFAGAKHRSASANFGPRIASRVRSFNARRALTLLSVSWQKKM